MPDYELIVGLETHVELDTRAKLFCACVRAFGAPPNSRVCPVCMGLPGALPTLNREAVRLAAVAGLALGCRVRLRSRFDRKHYFYPDLPKGYQITQADEPLCENGGLTVSLGETARRVRIERIHIEEDAGKLTHDARGTLLDMNRCGAPLIEIVTGPDFRSGAEAAEYLRQLRAILVECGVSRCRMSEGELRCDVNLSVRPVGSSALGQRTEIKNLNSFQSVERAIAAEYARQCALLRGGGAVAMETLRFDQRTGGVTVMRRKESGADYRFLPEPDLPDLVLTEAELTALRAALPELPEARKARLAATYALPSAQAAQLARDAATAAYFERAVRAAGSDGRLTNDGLHAAGGDGRLADRGLRVADGARPASDEHPAANASAAAQCVAGLLLGELTALAAGQEDDARLRVPPEGLGALARLLLVRRVNRPTGKRILRDMLDAALAGAADIDPEAYARERGWFQITDAAALVALCRDAMADAPQLAEKYRAGKTNVLQALLGKAMAASRGLADPEALAQAMREALAPPRAE